jgi:hypothetical protein
MATVGGCLSRHSALPQEARLCGLVWTVMRCILPPPHHLLQYPTGIEDDLGSLSKETTAKRCPRMWRLWTN